VTHSIHALGMTVRDIQGYLLDLYGVEVSAGLISSVTDGVMMKYGPGRTGRGKRSDFEVSTGALGPTHYMLAKQLVTAHDCRILCVEAGRAWQDHMALRGCGGKIQ
jgi:hypothetical protein